MSCETIQLTGVVQESFQAGAQVVRSLHLEGKTDVHADVAGEVTTLQLRGTVDETVSVSGKCRQP